MVVRGLGDSIREIATTFDCSTWLHSMWYRKPESRGSELWPRYVRLLRNAGDQWRRLAKVYTTIC